MKIKVLKVIKRPWTNFSEPKSIKVKAGTQKNDFWYTYFRCEFSLNSLHFSDFYAGSSLITSPESVKASSWIW